MSDNGTLEIIIAELSFLLEPLAEAAELPQPEGIFGFVQEIGLDLNIILVDPTPINGLAISISSAFSILRPIVEAGEIDESMTGELPEIIESLSNLMDSFDVFDSLQVKADFAEIAGDIGRIIFDYLMSEYLASHHPKIFSFFLLFGVARIETKGNKKFVKFDYQYLPKLFTDPTSIATDLYKWGTNNFDSTLLLEYLKDLFWHLGVDLYMKNAETITTDTADATAANPQQLRLPIFITDPYDASTEIGFALQEVAADGAKLPGLAIMPFIGGQASFNINLPDSWELIFKASTDASVPYALVIRPEDVEVSGIGGSAAPPSVEFSVAMMKSSSADSRMILIGSHDGPRLELGAIGLIANFSYSENPDFSVTLPVDSCLVLNASEGDGFLQNILPADGMQMDFEFSIGWSSKEGFFFEGSGGLEIKLATHISIGPITIQETIIGLKFKDGNLGLDAGATIKAELGPFTAIVENMGLTSTLSFPDKGGNLGPADLAFSFKPPTGIGLSLDTPAVRGGGYLFFDPDNERYGGALELSISNMFMVTAVGLITTRLPDGSKGFSLLLIINVQFTPGIALGMGFFLSGLGGLIGINRTLNEQALIEGVRSGSLDSILFPENIVANITRIISDIRLIFPPKRDQFMIGLMAKITWGVPALVSIEFGIIIEFKSPTRLAILGILQVALPTEEEALIIIKVSFAGIINFDEQYLSFDASLFGSRILTFTLEGDMALRLNWGDEKAFLMTVGGFHPAFEPPARFNLGNLKRLTLNILTGNPRLSLTTYFALTSNTVQFGALIDFYFKVSKFKAIAFFGFDVLFIFSPFRFIAEIRAGVAIKLGSTTLLSISLQFTLAGPTPWNAAGTGSFKILFFKVKVRFSKTWGDRKDILPTKVPVLPEILSALEQNRNWTAELPHRSFMLVTLRELDSEADGIVLQSYGSLTVSQTILPLDMEINKFGNNVPSDIERARISRMKIEGDEVEIDDVRDSFAPSAFTEMKDEDKLKSSSYVKERSGVRVRETDRIYVNHAIGRKVEYEVRTSDFDRKSDVPYELFTPLRLNRITEDGERFRLAALGGAVGRSDLARELRIKTTRRKVQLTSDLFSIAGMDNLKIFSDTTFTAGTEAEAHDQLKRIIKEKPDLEGKLQVTAEYQLAI
ncbi:MAG: hypothetical protein KAI50_07075 [Desulfobacterales bacterium]|nr:hypothetical protein [Desulfobacterales bacterium]